MGLYCLESGQSMEKHAHEIQCRFCIVLEGQGKIGIDDLLQESVNGVVVRIPAGQAHRILNIGKTRLIFTGGYHSFKNRLIILFAPSPISVRIPFGFYLLQRYNYLIVH